MVESAWPQSVMQGLTTPWLRAMTQKSQIVTSYIWMRTTSTARPLPTSDLRWENCDKLAESILEHPTDIPEGYILEVDLESPKELHEEHNAYPPAPKRMMVQKEWMSEYQYDLGNGVVPTEVEKLVPNVHNKERYVLHYRNLQLYVSLGMRLKKIHRAICFKQSPWMELYIRMNTEFRKQASSDFEKDLYTLMNNSVFGNTMENLRKRVDVKLVRKNEEDKLRRLIASPSFAGANIFDNDLTGIHMHKVICFSTGLCTPARAPSTSPNISCTTFKTTR